MSDTILGTTIFGALIVGIWLSYRLPPDFKPDWSWRCGDTYVGYEPASGRLALVDYPHGTVVHPSDVRSIEPSDEGTLGVVHRWVVVSVPQAPMRYRVWFGISSAKRDAALARLKEIVGGR